MPPFLRGVGGINFSWRDQPFNPLTNSLKIMQYFLIGESDNLQTITF